MTTRKTAQVTPDVPHVDQRDPAQRVADLREDIERTRQELGQTVAELAHKADLKARLRERTEPIMESTRKLVRWHPVPMATALSLLLGLLGYLWWRRH